MQRSNTKLKTHKHSYIRSIDVERRGLKKDSTIDMQRIRKSTIDMQRVRESAIDVKRERERGRK